MGVKHKVTAIIYDRRGRVLSVARNSYIKTHPYQARLARKAGMPHHIYLHAEIAAIIRCKDLDKAHTILVSRFNKKGAPMLAKPCPICMDAIQQAGIKHIEYTVGG